jgi:hypothetical protein
MSKTEGEFHLGNGDFMNIKSSQIVKLKEQFVVYTEEGPVYLNAEVHADFAEIPEKYHEIFFNVLAAKYMNKVSYGDNPFSQCRPMVKRKWYQFWKPKYIEQ